MAEEAVEMQFIMGSPGFPARLSACLASPTALIAPYISRGEPPTILMPSTVVRAGEVNELITGIDAYPCTNLRRFSSDETAAPPAPRKHQGGVLSSGRL